jgi:hypothetical protein
VQAGSGLRTVPVHGWLYAFRRDDGKMRGGPRSRRSTCFCGDELPVIVLTGRYQAHRWGGEPAYQAGCPDDGRR